jgi:succinoglycan biosynthesis transport protein ExoP
MTFNELILILKARQKIVVIIFLLIVSAVTIVSLVLPKTYEATASLILNYKGIDPVTGMTLPAQLMPGYMATQVDIITSRNVALKVVDKLKLTDSATVKIQFNKATNGQGDIHTWLADRLLTSLEVRPSKQSSVIEVVFKGTDPKFAALIANAFADAYEQLNVELKVVPSKKAADFLAEQTGSLRVSLEKAQSNLSRYQQENGITSLNGTLDIEIARMNELSSQLAMAQSQLYDSNSRNKSSKGNINTSPDVASNPLVQNLRVEVSRAETKITELSARYGEKHPQYISAKAELDKQRSLLQREISNASGNISESVNISKQRVEEIKAALAAQKDKVLKFNLARDELTVLQNEVANAEKAMDAASQRFTQTMQDGSNNQSDLTVLNPAIAPSYPTGPRVKLNIMISIFLGLLLGISTGVIIEMMDRRVRSKDDISKLLEVPVFAMIDCKPKKANNKLLTALPRRLIKSF